jgi:hypothetical protein
MFKKIDQHYFIFQIHKNHCNSFVKQKQKKTNHFLDFSLSVSNFMRNKKKRVNLNKHVKKITQQICKNKNKRVKYCLKRF